jgi:hypothetical protein
VIGYELPSCTGDDLLRLVRALGRHRYVGSRLHLVHAFAVEVAASALAPEARAPLADAAAWAERALGSGAIDVRSKDERLYRRATDAELALVLEAFWGSPPATAAARARLAQRLAGIDAELDPAALPFDEAREEEMFPVLVDAGWELVPLAKLDPALHKGAIQALDDYEVARFDEESAIPPISTLHELPALGGLELLHAFDDSGTIRAPFVLWQEGHEEYLDYVLRGVLRAAKLEPAPE